MKGSAVLGVMNGCRGGDSGDMEEEIMVVVKAGGVEGMLWW